MGRPKGSKNKPKVSEGAGQVPAPKRAATGRKRGRPRVEHPKETWSWLAKGHEAFELVDELLGTHFAGRLTVADARPLLRDGGKPVTWGCKLVSVPSYLKPLQVEGHTDRVLLIDKTWWTGASLQERKGRVHAALARAMKEKPVEISESALRAHGLYAVELRDVAEVGARQLTLELDEAKRSFELGGETSAGDPAPEPEQPHEVCPGRGPDDAAERAREIEELEHPAPTVEPHVPDAGSGYRPEDFDEDGTLKTLAERVEARERTRPMEPVVDEELPELEDAIAAAVSDGDDGSGLTLLDGEAGDPVEEDAGVREFAAAV